MKRAVLSIEGSKTGTSLTENGKLSRKDSILSTEGSKCRDTVNREWETLEGTVLSM